MSFTRRFAQYNGLHELLTIQMSSADRSKWREGYTPEIEQRNSSSSSSMRFQHQLIFANVTYVLTIGISGLVLCAIGSNLGDLAIKLEQDPTLMGGRAFMCRGIGSMLGALASSELFRRLPGDLVLMAGLLGIATLLHALPSTTSTAQLYVYFFLLGLCSAIDDTGCNILTRRLRGRKAGPWLGANGISFGMSAAIVPLIESITSDFSTQYLLLSIVVMFVAASVGANVIWGRVRSELTLGARKKAKDSDLDKYDNLLDSKLIIAPHYWVERAVAFMLFWLVGGQVDIVAYIAPYIEQTDVVARSSSGRVLLVFWTFVSVGRVMGVWDQYIATEQSLVQNLASCCVLGSVAMLLILIFPGSAFILWISVALYAISYGPTVAYCHDLNNRLTLPTEKSTSICMFGVNCGASFVPYLTSVAWKDMFSNKPEVLIAFVFLSMALPIPILLVARTVTYMHKPLRNSTTYRVAPYSGLTINSGSPALSSKSSPNTSGRTSPQGLTRSRIRSVGNADQWKSDRFPLMTVEERDESASPDYGNQYVKNSLHSTPYNSV